MALGLDGYAFGEQRRHACSSWLKFIKEVPVPCVTTRNRPLGHREIDLRLR
jgi:hypothetical protein